MTEHLTKPPPPPPQFIRRGLHPVVAALTVIELVVAGLVAGWSIAGFFQ